MSKSISAGQLPKTISTGQRIASAIGGGILGMVLGTCIAGPLGFVLFGKLGMYLGYKYADL